MTTKPILKLPGTISDKLAELRRAIRTYVLRELVAVVTLWLVATFWIFLALDYLPVRSGFGEMPRIARAIYLALVGGGLVYIVWRWGWRPLSARITPSRLAVLYERFFPQLGGRLVGAVELTAASHELADSPIGLELVHSTAESADAMVSGLAPDRVLNWTRLRRRIIVASIALASVLGWTLWQPGLAGLAVARLYGLSQRAWPRLVFLEVLGFEQRQRKVAKGGSLEIRVRADASRRTPPPSLCTIYYRLADGSRGSAAMSRDGEPREGFQNYVFRGKPFQGMQENVNFQVAGGDYRTDDYAVTAVDLPSLVKLEVVYQPPAYTQLAQQRRPWTPGLRLPKGAAVTLEGTSSKPLERLELTSDSRDTTNLPNWQKASDPKSFTIPVGKLMEPVNFNLALLDADGIVSPEPYAIRIQPIDDKPPEIGLRVLGIGNAITADARLPYEGKIIDDYAVKDAWFDITYGEQKLKLPIPLGQSPDLKAAVDFREQRASADQPVTLEPGKDVTVTIAADDLYDLDESAHAGTTDPLKLQVVRPDQLLAILEARELSLRRRFEDILSETQEQRDSLLRLQAAWRQLAGQPAAAEPATEPAAGGEGEKAAQPAAEGGAADGAEEAGSGAEAASLRELRVQRLIQFNQKVTSELAGLAAAFEDILVELDNNRVNSAEREKRIRELIVAPLLAISQKQLPAFDTTARSLERELGDTAQATKRTDEAVAELEQVVAAMQAILDNMLKMESFTEVLDLLRGLLDEQQQLLERTQEQQRRELLEGLLPE
ncbi:MAG: hypothetical protein U0795_08190 [Pirellulales bacterium]